MIICYTYLVTTTGGVGVKAEPWPGPLTEGVEGNGPGADVAACATLLLTTGVSSELPFPVAGAPKASNGDASVTSLALPWNIENDGGAGGNVGLRRSWADASAALEGPSR